MFSARYYKGSVSAVALADRRELLIDIIKVFTIAGVSKNNIRGRLYYLSFLEVKK